jgi:hypothetical protein
MIKDMYSLVLSVLKLFVNAIERLQLYKLEKHVEPLRAAARSHPSQLAWRAEPGTKEYRLYEKLVRAKLMVRSPWFPGQYMLPTRWH